MKKHYTKPLIHFFLFSFLFISFIGYAQPKRADKIKEFIINESVNFSEIPSIPEKWNNESAVVIIDHQNHYYNKTKKSLDNFFLTRRVIKLNDKAAVERFSEFNYPTFLIEGSKDIKTWMGIKIIKPNGDVKEIDVEKEKIKTSNDRKAYVYGFIGVKMKSDEIYKLAVPELEIGDIIDYYIYTYEEYRTYGAHVMDPIETTVSGEYPTMDFRLKLKVENDFFINFNSYNGAPELEDITAPKQRDKEYQLVAKNIEKGEPLQWLYPLVEYPSFKYQISFAQNGRYENMTYAFLSEKEDIIKKEVSSEDVLEEHKNSYNLKYIAKDIKKYFKEKELSKKELVEEAYYYMRHVYLNQYIEGVVATEEKLTDYYYPLSLYKNPIVVSKQGQFLLRFGSFLKRNDIPFEIIKAKYRYDGSIDDLLIRENLVSIIKVNLEEPIYVYPFNNNTFFNWLPSTIEGTEAYSLSFTDSYDKIENVEKIKLPISNYKDNNTREVSNINFNDDFSEITIDRNSFLKGHNKVNQINRRLFFFDYVSKEYEKYGTTQFSDILNKKNRKKYDQSYAAYKEKISQKRIERLEESTEDEFDFTIDDYQYEVLSTGRETIDDLLSFKEQYIIKDDLIKKAGPNYIFEVGKLIGSQVAIEEKEKSRIENIYMPYPRSYNNEIKVAIPDGYTVSGYDKLNLKVENETGGFVSEANLEGNILNIKTYKYYKNNYEPNSNWNKMLEFLEAGFQFSQEKILLKKS
ncbi:hypothetical protein [Aquimarina sp. 2201CG5-10]|uniref:hypothetical protein n=1 Tax=Aquimarina callyspongiae TaxID=3098150 RepID=UPI002AB380A2|nr:hypothetical protein [Aquimarina sp. 2201CG5-10]MDY8138954.1 hypothetical protein [Aquimarina sp. 2201CG5-10]